jgi:uracil-DNA glycosylase
MPAMNPDLARELTLLREFGYTHLDLETSRRNAETTSSAEPQSVAEALPPTQLAPPETSLDTGVITACSSLDEMAPIALACIRCKLANTRTQVVYGTGNPHADLMFVGEAPGRDEDLQGKPFVGRAGQLLTDIIKAMKLSRDDVYIANVIKCRPPENRNPEPDELEACRPYILQQIRFIKPKVIVTLGRFAVQSLTGKAYTISAIRGEWQEFEGVKLMPTYHPAYLLRNPSAKKEVWADMKKVMSELGIGA